MDTGLLIDHDRIVRAAEGMISNHGENAPAEANKRAQSLKYAGCDSLAEIWERICKVIQVRMLMQNSSVAIANSDIQSHESSFFISE